MKILIADDYEMVRKAASAFLANAKNAEVAEASNGEEAVREAMEFKPDLIILDVQMPVLDGLSAAQKIRAASPFVPILILTMHDGEYMVREAQRVGA